MLVCLPVRAGAVISGVLEEPGNGTDCTGIRNVRGWAYSTTGGTLAQPLRIFVDGVFSMEMRCCSSRGDVQDAHPEAPARTGFSGVFNFQLTSPGEHEIRVDITSTNDETLSLTSRCTSHRFGSETFLTNLDLDNEGAGFCESDLDDPTLICCEGVRVEGREQSYECSNVCYRWDRGAQGLVLTSGPVVNDPICDPLDE
jgi:hypothetical protein